MMYILVLMFIICSAVMIAGQGLYNYDLCFAATWICLILYTLPKLVMSVQDIVVALHHADTR